MHHRITALLLLPALVSSCSLFHNLPPEQRRAIIVSLDAGGEEIIDHLVADGAMPNLARLCRTGVHAAYSRTNFPSKTAAGHAALWTGGFADTNGITSNHVLKLPLAEHTIVEDADGFDSRELLSEPIWATAARAGRRAVVLQATHVAPLSTYMPGGRFGGPYPGTMTLMDGYSGVLAKETVYAEHPATWAAADMNDGVRAGVQPRAADLTAEGIALTAIAYDSPDDPTQGYDTLVLAPKGGGKPYAILHPGHWSGPVALDTPRGPGHCNFRLFSLAPDGSDLVLYRTPVVNESNNKPEAAEALYGPWPFIPQGAIQMWAHGRLGPTMYHGGDGTAEARYLDTVDFLLDEARERTRALYQRRDWDLAVSYLPFPDEALHAWYGTVDAGSPSYDPALAPRVWKLLDHVGAAIDRYLGTLPADDTVVAVTSDHGMAGLKWRFYVNTVLKQAGLLAVTPDGKVDLAHTRAFYPPTDGAFIVVNSQRHKGGIVPPDEIPAVLDQVQAALGAVKAADGTPLVTEFVRVGVNDRLPPVHTPSGEVADDLGDGGIRGGDLYLDLHPGYNFEPDWRKDVVTAPYEPGQGGHIFDPRRKDMHAALTLAGPGVKQGVEIGPVRDIDVAPTVAHLLGMPAPLRATGRVLEEALAE